MSKNIIKLREVSPCSHLDEFIKSYVTKNRNKSLSHHLFQRNSSSPNNQFSKTGFTHKTSLADWRSLYSYGRPKTQSLYLNVKQQVPEESKGGIKQKSVHWPRMKIKQEAQTTKTARHFYKNPQLHNEIEIIGHLTARMANSFSNKMPRKMEHLSRRRAGKDKKSRSIYDS